MIDELGPEARTLLDAARAGMSPDAAAVRRMRAKLGVTTGVAAGAAGAKLAIAKLVLGLVGVSAVVGGGWYVARGVDPARSAAVIAAPSPAVAPAHAPAAAPVHAPAAARPTVSDEELITIEPPERVARPERIDPAGRVEPVDRAEQVAQVVPTRRSAEPAPARPASRQAAVRAQPAAGKRPTSASPDAPARPPLDLAHEVALVDQAMAALRRGDTHGALAAVQRHAAETGGRGQLAEDAAAIEIEALCRQRDAAAGAKLTAFDARFPRSAQRARLAAQCR